MPAETGAALVDEADYIQFTGSTGSGRRIAQRAADRLIPYSLELGGKDAMIVLADADLARAANAAVWGAMFNSGQTCTSVERVYVEEPAYDEFVELVVERVQRLRQGAPGKGYDADIGALSGEAQLAVVERHVSEALAKGARALVGGKRADIPGAFFEPTVLVDVDQSMRCMRDETFGPTLPVMKVHDVDEAIRLANESSFGLSATVWTRDRAHGEQIARRLEVGAVNVNDMFANLFALPIPQGGWKQSGVGARLGGAHGVRKYCRPQAITTARLTPTSELLWYPYTAAQRQARPTPPSPPTRRRLEPPPRTSPAVSRQAARPTRRPRRPVDHAVTSGVGKRPSTTVTNRAPRRTQPSAMQPQPASPRTETPLLQT